MTDSEVCPVCAAAASRSRCLARSRDGDCVAWQCDLCGTVSIVGDIEDRLKGDDRCHDCEK